MMFIMGLSTIIVAFCSLFPNGSESWLALQMEHVAWNGLRHHDTIFPTFLFIAGISFPFSYAKQLANGKSRKQIYQKIIYRGCMLIFLGLVYNGLFKLDFANLRCASVLARIGIAWMVAALLYINFGTKTRGIIAAAILVGYYVIIRFFAAPDMPGADPLSMEGNMVGYIDRLFLPGILLYNNGTFDPEGILSALPAVVTAMGGMFTGELVRRPESEISGSKKTVYMLAAAAAMLVAGLLWSLDFPINKMLWSSTFVLVVGSYSLALFAIFYYLVDVKGWTKWVPFFSVVGMNSITIYLAQRIFDFKSISNFFLKGLAGYCPEALGNLILVTGYFAVSWLFLYFLYKKKVFLKV